MTKKQNRVTAAELIARLQADPEWVRDHEEKEAKRKLFEAQLDAEERPLIAELAEVGILVTCVYDLVNARTSYPAAISVLARHLLLPYHTRIREGIARALTVKEARGTAARVVLDELKWLTQPDEKGEFRWTLANALTVIGDKTMEDEIKMLIADDRYQDVHERLQEALKKRCAAE